MTRVWSLALVVVTALAGCTPPAGSGRPCSRDGECPIGDSCDEGTCRFTGRYPIPLPVRRDAGEPAPDAGVTDGGTPVVDAGDADGGDGVDAGPSDGGVLDAGPPRWDPAWSHREKLRLHGVDYEVNLTDVQVAVRLADVIPDDERSAADADVRFVDADDVGELAYELEGTGAETVAWVRVPQIDGDHSEDFIWLYWGNDAATDGQDTAATWAGWTAVFHMSGDVNGKLVDSTGNGHDADPGVTTDVTGFVGRGRAFASAGGISVDTLAGAAFPQDEGTVMLMARVSDTSVQQSILDTRATGNQLLIEAADDDAVFNMLADGVSTEQWARRMYNNNWYPLSFTWSAQSNRVWPRMEFARPADSFSMGTFRPTDQQMLLGSTLTGRLDEVRVRPDVLGNQHLDAHYESARMRMVILGEVPVPPPAPPRTLARVADTTVMYEFDEGAGTAAADTGAAGLGLDLVLDEPERVDWFTGGAHIRGRAFFSRADAPGFATACAAGDITVEAWLMADNALNAGPSRVFTFSADTSTRNLTLGQESERWVLRHVTSTTSSNGDTNPDQGGVSKPRTPQGSVAPGDVQHVVFVRGADSFKTYLDGVEVDDRVWGGTVDGTWDPTMGLGVGNEFGNDRSWLGAVYLVAVYCRALSAVEVGQNFNAGP